MSQEADQFPEFITPEDAERQENLFEWVGSFFDVDDEFLRALLLNSVISGRVEQQQTELLREIRDQTAVEDGIRQEFNGELIPFPVPNGIGAFPGDQIVTIDFRDGDVFGVPIQRFTLENQGIEEAFGGALFADVPLVVTTFDKNDEETGQFPGWGPGFLEFANTKVARIDIESPTGAPYRVGGALHTGLTRSIVPNITSGYVSRFGRVASTNDPTNLTAVPFAPIENNLTNQSSIGNKAGAVDEIGNGTLSTRAVSQSRFIIENAGNNSADVQVLNFDFSDEQAVADNDIHGTTDPTDTIQVDPTNPPATDPVVFESGVTSQLKTFRAQSTAAGQPTELRIQWFGLVPSMR